MKCLFNLVVAGCFILITSCGNGSNTPPAATVVPDTTSANSISWLAYNADSMYLKDLTVNNYPVIALHASDSYNPTDSVWTLLVQVEDKTNTSYAMNLTAQSRTPTGIFTVMDNSSTFTDYGKGFNKRTYSIDIGSVINVDNASPFVKGEMSLNLHFNSVVTTAVDTFVMYH